MRKTLYITVSMILFASGNLSGLETCRCGSMANGSTITYWTEGGCCSGIASAGVQDIWAPSGDGAYELVDTNSMSGDAAQSKCCD